MSSSKNTVVRVPLAIWDVIKQAKSFSVASYFTGERDVQVDNFIFALHSTVTVAILSLSIVFVGMKQYFGEPIECLTVPTGPTTLSQAQMQHYCWMEGAFTVYRPPGLRGRQETGRDSAYAGVQTYKSHEGDLKMPHKYYQWVYYILCIQCILFYIPKHIWRMREDRRLKNLIRELKYHHLMERDDLTRYQLVQDTVDSILISDDYFYSILFAEFLSLVNLVLQIWFMNLFLGGNFLLLGLQWLNYSHHAEDVHYDPLIRVFPRLTKCVFHKFGHSGSIETLDTLCFMSMNIVNEKIFVILWFWFLFLLLVTTFHLMVYRVAIICIPWFRFYRIKAIAPTANKIFLRKLVSRPGNWFVLHTIAANLKPYYFRDLLEEVQAHHFNKEMKPESTVTLKDFCREDGKVHPSLMIVEPSDKKKDKDKKKKGNKDKNKDKEKDKGPAPEPGFTQWPDDNNKDNSSDWPTEENDWK